MIRVAYCLVVNKKNVLDFEYIDHSYFNGDLHYHMSLNSPSLACKLHLFCFSLPGPQA